MTQPRFIHLRIHSDYSIIDGLIKVSTLVETAASMNMPALALTDCTNFFGIIKFYKSAYSVGIKPIIGADLLIKSNTLGDELTELTILTTNNLGYHNLIMLISKAYKRGYGTDGPFIDRDWLIKYNEGLIIISGARKGDLEQTLMRGQKIKFKQCLAFYQRYFKDRYYLGLIRTGRPEEEQYIKSSVELSNYYGLPVVANNDVRFIHNDDYHAHAIKVAIHEGSDLFSSKRKNNYSSQQYLRSEQDMCELFADIPESLANSVEIARKCNVTIRLDEYFLPTFPISSNISIEDYLIKSATKGLEDRLNFSFPDAMQRSNKKLYYNERLNKELKVINKMGFAGYFLIVMEFIKWSKDNNIPVGPGRGSGSGSLVAYALNITDIDPLVFDLIFERFLNPERVSMPDFDIDFCMEKRDMVIDHVAQTYGRDAVSQIITFGTMAAKAVIRDVGRVLGYPYPFINSLAKLVPNDIGIKLEQALILEPELQKLYILNEDVKVLIDIAKKLEGMTRNVGKHAGGVVISPTKITDFSPLYCDEQGNYPVTQFDKNDVENAGLVKFDFLGLRTLTIINRTLKIINTRYVLNNINPINIQTIPLDDKKSFKMLQSANTTAVFQLESKGMKELIKRLQPDCFEDIIALVALFRPGPLKSGMVDNFINRKHGREAICYPDINWQHKSLKPVLEPTYGIILYQEQVMQIARILAGYTLGEADILRRAMGKKNYAVMVKQRAKFKAGAELLGINGELSMKIFNLLEKFAGYGFNKSHSAAYALVSYQTMWLKVHYPAEFMAAAMTADIDNHEKIIIIINECLRMGIVVLPPDINKGQYHFHVNENREIIYGMGAIKCLGKAQISSIIEERNKNGKFVDLFNLCKRIDIKKLNRRMLEKLILSGACDKLGPHRAAIMKLLDLALKTADQSANSDSRGQIDIFGVNNIKNQVFFDQYLGPNFRPWSETVMLNGERETLGIYLTGNPITQYLNEIKYYTGGVSLKDIHCLERGKQVTVVGLILSLKIKVTKQGNKICICTINYLNEHLDVIIFTPILQKYKNFLQKDTIVLVAGEVSVDNVTGSCQLIAINIMDINTARKKFSCGLAISLTKQQINKDFLKNISLTIKPHLSGIIPVHIYSKIENVRIRMRFGTNWQVMPTDDLLNDLRLLVGHEQVQLEFD
ncbi:DNA polymerase III subunit alpha [Candidatus Palibaumannia cicadellinicola]|uniref:DNA polymerase III subunit alpha n=1 Tax=Candidatus Palibaumannia cicadellinicola TaxID=186490 RepID=A0A0K2BL77_9GAMM|nr:DNA polymerase III subunit alpha [Candidatus Baumannia cicadellinicola]AKZ66070.1 DNA polymerase III alpha subunit [Candidatus Baumannia cicadellinicola]